MTKVANTAVLNKEQSGRGKGIKRKYTHYTGGQRAKVAKYAAECGNLATIRHFKNEFPSLGESTARLFKKQYCHKVKGGIVQRGWGFSHDYNKIYLKTELAFV